VYQVREAWGYGETELDRAAGLLAGREAAAVMDESEGGVRGAAIPQQGTLTAESSTPTIQ
jgi:hypothetical protein